MQFHISVLSLTLLVCLTNSLLVSSFQPLVPRRQTAQESFPFHALSRTLSSRMASTGDSETTTSTGTEIKFLGRGKDAIVRPGVVLVAPPDEYHHFLRESAVFIYAMGEDDDGVYVIRGVIIDHPTPFTMHEMMPAGQTVLDGNADDQPIATFLRNLLYRGGELGDAVFMLHSDQQLGEQAKQEVIGSSGIYQGGLEYAEENNYEINPDQCKFFFSFMEFTEAEMEEMLENRADESTQWLSVEVPPDFVLNSEWERGKLGPDFEMPSEKSRSGCR